MDDEKSVEEYLVCVNIEIIFIKKECKQIIIMDLFDVTQGIILMKISMIICMYSCILE